MEMELTYKFEGCENKITLRGKNITDAALKYTNDDHDDVNDFMMAMTASRVYCALSEISEFVRYEWRGKGQDWTEEQYKVWDVVFDKIIEIIKDNRIDQELFY